MEVGSVPPVALNALSELLAVPAVEDEPLVEELELMKVLPAVAAPDMLFPALAPAPVSDWPKNPIAVGALFSPG